MILNGKYLKKVLSLKHGKLILAGQVIVLLTAMVVFAKTIPWLMAHDISKIENYESPTPKPPSWAQSFSVNHGSFIYYDDSRSSNPKRLWLYLGANLAFILPVMISTSWIMKKQP